MLVQAIHVSQFSVVVLAFMRNPFFSLVVVVDVVYRLKIFKPNYKTNWELTLIYMYRR